MSFRERTAWVMALVMALAGLYYLYVVRDLGPAAPPTLAYFIMVMIAVGSVLAKVALAAWSHRAEDAPDYAAPSLADRPADERERPLIDRAGNWSGWVLGIGVVAVMWHFSQDGDGVLMFHLLVGCLIVAQFAEYAFQIFLFRRHS